MGTIEVNTIFTEKSVVFFINNPPYDKFISLAMISLVWKPLASYAVKSGHVYKDFPF